MPLVVVDHGLLLFQFRLPEEEYWVIFDLSGNLVRILQRGRQAAGSYTTAWDGTNQSGRIVARGMYFIRVYYYK